MELRLLLLILLALPEAPLGRHAANWPPTLHLRLFGNKLWLVDRVNCFVIKCCRGEIRIGCARIQINHSLLRHYAPVLIELVYVHVCEDRYLFAVYLTRLLYRHLHPAFARLN